jgi:signal transduction histidine kinase/CheY-like chemotaxis protein
MHDHRIPVTTSLFGALRSAWPGARVTRASKGTMVVTSHLIEELVAASPDRTVLISGFQHGRHWAVERDKYLQLAGRHDVIAVFAGQPPPVTWEVEHVGVRLGDGDPLTQEWFVLALGPGLAVTLCGLDGGERLPSDQDPPADDSDRLFEVIWSFDPEMAQKALAVVLEAIERSAPERVAEVQAALDRVPRGPIGPQEVAHSADHLVAGLVTRLEGARTREVAAIRRVSEAKNSFLSRMSHELRTPLNAILGFTQLLQLETDGRDDESLHHIAQAGEHLVGLIDEILDIARIEEGALRLHPEPVDVSLVLEDALALVAPQAAERGIRIERDVAPLHVVADPQRLRQILINLLSNAVKYNSPAGEIRVRAGRDADTVRVAVTDTGGGIAVEDLGRLFVPFERLSATSAAAGTGLGLTISQRLAVAMGGRIEVESRVGRGSTFTLALPLATVPGPPGEPAPGPGAAGAPGATGTQATLEGGRVDVVYVEDNPSNVLLMERTLARHAGLRMEAIGTVAGAVQRVRALQPSLVLLDLDLPDGDGAEVLAALRRDPATRLLPVLIVSSDATDDARQRLAESGATDFLTKPFDLRRLLEAVRSALA